MCNELQRIKCERFRICFDHDYIQCEAKAINTMCTFLKWEFIPTTRNPSQAIFNYGYPECNHLHLQCIAILLTHKIIDESNKSHCVENRKSGK